MQVDPIQPTLKPPRTKDLKLKCDKLPSTFAFKFNLRRHTMVPYTSVFEYLQLLKVLSREISVCGPCAMARGSLQTSTRPTLNRRTESTRLYEPVP